MEKETGVVSNSKGVVVITGASAGVGRACVRAFADKGYDVATLARGREGMEAARKEVEERGRRAVFYEVDVADADAMEEAAEKTEQELYAAETGRRETYIGWSTVKAIVGNKIAPWYADQQLAKTAFDGQQTDEPEDPDRKHNLWEPVPGDHGAHGDFDDEAQTSTSELWFSRHSREITWTVVALLLILIIWAILE